MTRASICAGSTATDRWFNELLLTYEESYNCPRRRHFGNGAVYTYQPQQDATIIDVGPGESASPRRTRGSAGPGIAGRSHVQPLAVAAATTRSRPASSSRGSTLTAQDAEDINPQFFYDVNPTGTATIPYKAFFTDARAGTEPGREVEEQAVRPVPAGRLGADTSKLTLNLGVRWDYERTPAYLDHVTPANVVAALNRPGSGAPPGQTYAQALALGGVNVNDYISNGNNRYAPTRTRSQPRLGFSYDLHGRPAARDLRRRRPRLRSRPVRLPAARGDQVGAAHDTTSSSTCPSGRARRLRPACTGIRAYLNGLANLQSLVALTNAGQEVDMINNSLKVPYSDQFSLGMRNRVGRLEHQRRRWRASSATTASCSRSATALPNGAFFQNGEDQPCGNPIPGFGSLIIGNNGIETRTTQVLLSMRKAVHRGVALGRDVRLHVHRCQAEPRHQRALLASTRRPSGEYPFIASNAAPKHRWVTTGTLRGRGRRRSPRSGCSRHPFRTTTWPAICRTAQYFPPAASARPLPPGHRIHSVTRTSTCRSARTSRSTTTCPYMYAWTC